MRPSEITIVSLVFLVLLTVACLKHGGKNSWDFIGKICCQAEGMQVEGSSGSAAVPDSVKGQNPTEGCSHNKNSGATSERWAEDLFLNNP